MSFASRFFVVFTLALLVSIGLIAAGVTLELRRAFEERSRQESSALVAQFQHELERRQQEIARRVQEVADAEGTVRMAIELLSRPKADISVYANDALGVSRSRHLDFLDFVSSDGSIFSSAEWPARVGASLPWMTQADNWAARGGFLTKVDTPDGPALGLLAVSTVRVGDRDLYVVGGERLDKGLLAALAFPPGMRALLYLDLDPSFQETNLVSESGPVAQGERLAPFVNQVRQQPVPQTFQMTWTPDRAGTETFQALPLLGRERELLAVLFLGSTQHDAVLFERRILLLAVLVGAAGLLFGVLLSWWSAARYQRPALALTDALRQVSQGDLNVRLTARGHNEMAQLAGEFNRMSEQLGDVWERRRQAEHVAAWREVSRGLAREIERASAPLQTAADNLERARQQNPELLDEVARASADALAPGLAGFKTVTGRFQNFARVPALALGPINLNDLVRRAVKLFEPQFGAVGRPTITPELHLDETIPATQADSALLERAIENLVLNAMDAMPGGGVLMLRTSPWGDGVALEVADTGMGMSPEDRERIFTPGYTIKPHGAEMGLAVVQSIVADHGGRISIESEPGVGTSFHVHLPSQPPERAPHAVAAQPANSE